MGTGVETGGSTLGTRELAVGMMLLLSGEGDGIVDGDMLLLSGNVVDIVLLCEDGEGKVLLLCEDGNGKVLL